MAEARTTLHGEGGEAGDALRRVQDFDPQSLVREAELGKKFAMREAVDPAIRIIDLFKQIRPSQVDYFPPDQQKHVKDLANSFYNLLEEVASFDVEEASPNPSDAKEALIARLESQFQSIFNALYPLISFANVRSLDFAKLERDARAATQAAKDSASNLLSELSKERDGVATIVGEVRALAAEQGVSKQAIHFKTEADLHKEEARKWREYTTYTAVGLGAFALASLFFHEIPGLDASTPARSAQIAVSKVLIFGVIAYMLSLCAKNFLSHRHNEVINRHRQNALATFSALAEATSDAASSDIVLSHAAACIFSPQDTGYVKAAGPGASDVVPMLQMMPRIGSGPSPAA